MSTEINYFFKFVKYQLLNYVKNKVTKFLIIFFFIKISIKIMSLFYFNNSFILKHKMNNITAKKTFDFS